jgi:hypothetical protein
VVIFEPCAPIVHTGTGRIHRSTEVIELVIEMRIIVERNRRQQVIESQAKMILVLFCHFCFVAFLDPILGIMPLAQNVFETEVSCY